MVPSYTYRCDTCDNEVDVRLTFAEHDAFNSSIIHEVFDSDPQGFTTVGICPGVYQQVLSFSYRPSLREHYNPTVGQHISTSAQFRSELTRASDIQSERTGIAHNYQPVDIDDPQSLGVTGEGLDATYAEETRSGRREAKKYL